MSISALRFGAVAPAATLSTVQAAPVAAPVAQQPAATFTPRSLGLGDLVGGRARLVSAQPEKPAPEPETPSAPEPETPTTPDTPTDGGGKPDKPDNACRPGWPC